MSQHREQNDVAELVMKLYDRLGSQFDNAKVVDAMLLVEIDDGSTVNVEDGTEDGREVASTVVLIEATDDRLVIQLGMIEFCRRTLFTGDDDDEGED